MNCDRAKLLFPVLLILSLCLTGLSCGDGGGGSEPVEDAASDLSGDVALDTPLPDDTPPDSGCVPSCDGRTCGDDGCGGSCGTCPGGLVCTAAGSCTSLDCEGAAYFVSGALETDAGAVIFTDATVQLFHSGGEAPCVARAEITLGIGGGCTLEVATGAFATQEGAILLESVTFVADEACPADLALEGTWLDAGTLFTAEIDVLNTPPAGVAACYLTSISLHVQGALTSGDGEGHLTVLDSSVTIAGAMPTLENQELGCPCAPDCAGKDCGGDGCGGACGTCGDTFDCVDGLCMPPVCPPACDGKDCGDDGCGGSCGACAGAQVECVEGLCVCAPACDGMDCGDDGCGGSCGACVEPQDLCVEGLCVCQPACLGMECGDDGCGAACGICVGPQELCVAGVCACQPDCGGKLCGADGCGAACGGCVVGEECVQGACTTEPQLGKPCGSDFDCAESGKCLGSFCTAQCKVGSTPIIGACDAVNPGATVAEVFGCPMDADVCLPGNVDGLFLACATDADCIAAALDGFVCGLVFEDGEGGLEGRCIPASGRAPAGAPCPGGDGSGCATLICLSPDLDSSQEGVCASYCDPGIACSAGTLCAMVPASAGVLESYVAMCTPFEGSLAPCQATADCAIGQELCGAVIGHSGAPKFVCLQSDNPQGLWLEGSCAAASDCFEQYCIFETWAANVDAYCTRPCVDDGGCSPGTACRPMPVAPFGGVLPGAPFELSVCLKVEEGAPCFVAEAGGCEFPWSTCAPIPGGVGWIGTCVSGECPPDCTDKACREENGCGGLCFGACIVDGVQCFADAECFSEQCVEGLCCNAPCDGECESCAQADALGVCLPIPPGDDPEDECGPCNRCNGQAACAFLPVGLEPDGLCSVCEICDGAGACASTPLGTDPAEDCGFCDACDGEGGCGPVEAGLDPKEACDEMAPATCATTGVCGGDGTCALWDDVTCGEPSCVSGFQVGAPTCDGEGGCVPPVPIACAPYVCAEEISGCLGFCEDVFDCVEDFWCQGGVCEPLPDCPLEMKVLCGQTVPANTGFLLNNWESYGECGFGNPYVGPELVYEVELGATTRVSMQVHDMTFDAAIVRLETGCDPSVACVDLVDLYPAGGAETMIFDAEAGMQYHLAVDGWSAEDKGEMMITFDCCELLCAEENACGDDGCGGSCGVCGETEICAAGQCQDCTDDQGFEPNDLCEDGTAVTDGAYEGLLLCPAGDVDWFSIDLLEGDQVAVLLEFEVEQTNLDLALFDADCETLLVNSESLDDEEVVQFIAPAAGSYRLRVLGADGGTGDYVLSILVNPAECLSDEDCEPGLVCGLFECVVPPGACPTVSTLACDDVVTGSTVDLDAMFTEYNSCGVSFPGNEAIHGITVDTETVVTFALTGLPLGGALALLEGQCAASWACTDAAKGSTLEGLVLTARLLPGVEVFVVVDGNDVLDVGEYSLTTSCCTPVCDGKDCGADGCGLSCGECTGAQDLCVEDLCVCQPDCGGTFCGDDGCGGSCGDCAGPQDLCVEGLCQCQPLCEGLECGDDGCGGSCGDCGEPPMGCVAGSCECIPDCQGIQCGDDSCGGSCGVCVGPQELCVGGLCECQSDCLGKICGDDGCGGSCGTCGGPQDQCFGGFCVCQPACAGMACGDDGCEGSCGVCASGRVCNGASCVCPNDEGFEPNNSCGAATPTLPGTYAVLGICPAADEDWYAIQVTQGQTLTLEMEFDHDKGDLDMFLYVQGNCVAYVASAITSTDDEAISFVAPATTTYLLRVLGFEGDAENGYSLTVMMQ
ncbi:MAG: PPC domain-containing protein [Pseudomonadota bacterium]